MRLPLTMPSSPMAANASELTGTLQKIKETGRIVRHSGSLGALQLSRRRPEGDWICRRYLHADRLCGEARNQRLECGCRNAPGHFVQSHSTDDEWDGRFRMLFHHQQCGPAAAGGVHEFAFSVEKRNPGCSRRTGSSPFSTSQGQAGCRDIGLDQYGAAQSGQCRTNLASRRWPQRIRRKRFSCWRNARAAADVLDDVQLAVAIARAKDPSAYGIRACSKPNLTGSRCARTMPRSRPVARPCDGGPLSGARYRSDLQEVVRSAGSAQRPQFQYAQHQRFCATLLRIPPTAEIPQVTSAEGIGRRGRVPGVICTVHGDCSASSLRRHSDYMDRAEVPDELVQSDTSSGRQPHSGGNNRAGAQRSRACTHKLIMSAWCRCQISAGRIVARCVGSGDLTYHVNCLNYRMICVSG